MDLQNIKKIIEEFLGKMNMKVDRVDVSDENSGNPKFQIQSSDAPILIGRRGEHFSAIQHLLKKIILKDAPLDFKFSIDINGYQEESLNAIKSRAKVLAERAKSFKTEVEMEPMSSYERMAIHTLFESDPNIQTESRGEGAERRIILKYVESKEIKDSQIGI